MNVCYYLCMQLKTSYVWQVILCMVCVDHLTKTLPDLPGLPVGTDHFRSSTVKILFDLE